MSNEIVWNSTLDDRYDAVVTRTAPYQGELTISESGKILHVELRKGHCAIILST
jgi:hypothetical protein